MSGSPITTTFSYNLFGEITGIVYSDSTPQVALTYNSLGLLEGASNAAAWSWLRR